MTRYVDFDLFKSYLGISGTGDDVLLISLLEHASKAVDSYTGRTFQATSDTTRYFDALGEHIIDGRTLLLDDDLCSITTLTNGDGTVITSSYYTTAPRNSTPYYAIRLKDNSTYTWTYTTSWESAISIVGKWAYSTTPPDDVVQAALRWAGYLYKQKDAQVFDTTAIPEAGVIQIPAGVPPDVRMLLRPYKRVKV